LPTAGAASEIVAVSLWESEEAVYATEGPSYWLRAFGVEAAGGEVTGLKGTRSSPRRRGERILSQALRVSLIIHPTA
jgi:hypothetical protein